jgi:hypothetical protein
MEERELQQEINPDIKILLKKYEVAYISNDSIFEGIIE